MRAVSMSRWKHKVTVQDTVNWSTCIRHGDFSESAKHTVNLLPARSIGSRALQVELPQLRTEGESIRLPGRPAPARAGQSRHGHSRPNCPSTGQKVLIDVTPGQFLSPTLDISCRTWPRHSLRFSCRFLRFSRHAACLASWRADSRSGN